MALPCGDVKPQVFAVLQAEVCSVALLVLLLKSCLEQCLWPFPVNCFITLDRPGMAVLEAGLSPSIPRCLALRMRYACWMMGLA